MLSLANEGEALETTPSVRGAKRDFFFNTDLKVGAKRDILQLKHDAF